MIVHKKRKLRKEIKLFLIVFLAGCLVISGFLLFKMLTKPKPSLVNKENKKFGTYQVKRQDNLEYIILQSENENLNQWVKQTFESQKQLVKKEGDFTFDCQSDLYFDTLAKVSCSLTKEKENLQTDTVIYNIKKNRKLVFDDIFRYNQVRLTEAFPEINNLNHDKLDVNETSLFVDTLEIKIADYPQLFKVGNGFKTIYEGEELVPKKFNIDTSKKYICFTFDDGPRGDVHEKVRALFDKHEIPATFYMIGNLIEEKPEVIKQTYLNGHTIANHSYSHPGLPSENLTTMSDSQVREEIESTDDIVFKIIGNDPVTFRPPGGFMDERVENLSSHEFVLWTVDSNDWRHKKDWQHTYHVVKEHIHENAIVLFHDIYDATYEAVSRLVPELIAEGYQFVDIQTLLNKLNANQ